MNPLGHIFITYIVTSWIIADARSYIFLIMLLAVVVDIDHIPGFFTFPKQKKRDYATQVAHFRSVLQEPIGVAIELLVLLGLWILGINPAILQITGIAMVMHWLIDFLMVHTRPLYPFSNKLVCLFFKDDKSKKMSEVVVTLISGAAFLILII